MPKVKLAEGFQKPVRFTFGPSSIVVGTIPTDMEQAQFDSIQKHYPGWIVEVKPGVPQGSRQLHPVVAEPLADTPEA